MDVYNGFIYSCQNLEGTEKSFNKLWINHDTYKQRSIIQHQNKNELSSHEKT